jgi:hypothetical protein
LHGVGRDAAVDGKLNGRIVHVNGYSFGTRHKTNSQKE